MRRSIATQSSKSEVRKVISLLAFIASCGWKKDKKRVAAVFAAAVRHICSDLAVISKKDYRQLVGTLLRK